MRFYFYTLILVLFFKIHASLELKVKNTTAIIRICKTEIDRDEFLNIIIDAYNRIDHFASPNSILGLTDLFFGKFFRNTNTGTNSSRRLLSNGNSNKRRRRKKRGRRNLGDEVKRAYDLVEDCFSFISSYDPNDKDVYYIVIPSNKLSLNDILHITKELGFHMISDFLAWKMGENDEYCDTKNMSIFRSLLCLFYDIIGSVKDFLHEKMLARRGSSEIFDVGEVEYYDTARRKGEKKIKSISFSFKDHVKIGWEKREKRILKRQHDDVKKRDPNFDKTKSLVGYVKDKYNKVKNITSGKNFKKLSYVAKNLSPILGYTVKHMSRVKIADSIKSVVTRRGDVGYGIGTLTDNPEFISECYNNNDNNITNSYCVALRDEYLEMNKNFFTFQSSPCVWEGYGPQHNNIMCWDFVSFLKSTWNKLVEWVQIFTCSDYPNPRDKFLGYYCFWSDGLPDSRTDSHYTFIRILPTTIFERLFPNVDFVGISCEEYRTFPNYFSAVFRFLFGLADDPVALGFCLIVNIFWVLVILLGIGVIAIIVSIISYYVIGFFVDARKMRKRRKAKNMRKNVIFSKGKAIINERRIMELSSLVKQLQFKVDGDINSLEKTNLFLKNHLNEHIKVEEEDITTQPNFFEDTVNDDQPIILNNDIDVVINRRTRNPIEF